MAPLRIRCLQHVDFEGPGSIAAWAQAAGHVFEITRLYRNDALPDPEAVDFLVVMGGPMGVHDERKYPWLSAEKQFIRQVIDRGKSAIGICLGAQLMADVLGAAVYPNPQKEIGWFPVELSTAGRQHPLLAGFPDRFSAFHWHGDTFALPEGALQLAGSAACGQQAFLWRERVLGIQFHPEVTPESLKAMMAAGRDELVADTWVQPEAEILSGYTPDNIQRFSELLSHFSRP
ncbi:type 1 glutamine amidotransferase [Compostibacter hankyongensis]|uniref:Type 1 glutamine amidotransferase n=1 Tax=Compostibacter hankyongensis TaxID=1007089 RepID=A0ABP8G8T2_9BACT